MSHIKGTQQSDTEYTIIDLADLEYSGTTEITITQYTGHGGSIIIPAEIDGISITSIGDHAFDWKRLAGISIPNSVTSIRDDAFTWNKLTSITIGVNVTLATSTFPSFYDQFEEAYNDGGILAGTYKKTNAFPYNWTRQQ